MSTDPARSEPEPDLPAQESGHGLAPDLAPGGVPAPGAQQVMVIRDPEDTPATQQLLRTLNDPDRGILVIGAMPYINSPRDLACCVFDALGKDMHRYKNGNLPGQAWDSAVAWTRAYRLHTVVVNRAHTLPSGLYDHLRELLLPDGPRLARLVLIDSSSAKRYTVIDRFRAPDYRLEHGDVSRLSRIRPSVESLGPFWSRLEIPDDLPGDSFLTFRAACARTLGGPEMKRVDELYVRSMDDARQVVTDTRIGRIADSTEAMLPSLALAVSVRLAARMNVAAPGECLVRLRGTQAGLIHEGILLHHQADPAGRHGLGHRFTKDTVTKINRSMTTPEAAAAVLYLLFSFGPPGRPGGGWSPDDLTLEDVTYSGSHVRIAGVRVPVPHHAQVALRAHHQFRYKQGARNRTSRYFQIDKQRPSARLLAARGLAGSSDHTSWAAEEDRHLAPGDHNTIWMWQRRLVLRNLVRPSLGLDLSLPRWT